MSVTIRQGHVLDVLAGMAPESCHLAVTSPPYFRLRRYGCPPQVWPELDGRPPCAEGGHAWIVEETDADGNPLAWHCDRCGAWKGELGSEPLPGLFVAHLVAVFRGVRRVLRRDGTCWINLAGSYLNNPGGQNGTSGHVSAKAISANGAAGRQDRTGALPRGYWLRPLNFVDTPGLLAHALQRDGWIWRADLALVKKSPLPESVQGWRWERCRVKVGPRAGGDEGHKYDQFGQRPVGNFRDETPENAATNAQWADCPGCPKCAATDGYVLRRGNGRPTRAWERFMVFAREPGGFWDSEAVRQQHAGYEYTGRSGVNRSGYTPPAKDGVARASFAIKDRQYHPAGRNLLDWQFWPTKGAQLQEAHYASYPPDLAALAIRAGTSERGCCATCGAPWARVVEREGETARQRLEARGAADYARAYGNNPNPLNYAGGHETNQRPTRTVSWRPTCSCPQTAPPAPAVVLDPFAGSGSSLIAADRLGRDAVGIDLNADYARMAVRRVTRDAPLLAQVTHDAPPQPTVLALPLDLAGAGAAAGAVADEAAGE